MIDHNVIPYLMNNFPFVFDYPNVTFPNLWWFHDGAPAHRVFRVSQLLHMLFGNNVVALNEEREWPSRSPDLTPLDVFLWGYVKSKVYRVPPPDIASLQRRIIYEVDLLRDNRQMLHNVMQGMIRRANRCLERNGRHVEGVVA